MEKTYLATSYRDDATHIIANGCFISIKDISKMKTKKIEKFITEFSKSQPKAACEVNPDSKLIVCAICRETK